MRGGRDRTTPALMVKRGWGSGEVAGRSGASWIVGSVSKVAWAVATDA